MSASESTSESESAPESKKPLLGLIVGAIGVVYGDIGTSPLYAMKECFSPGHRLALNEASVLGVLSLVFWIMCIVVSVKYVYCILRADNRGEGGILALMALATRLQARKRGQFSIYVVFGVFGAALFYGDGMITPAISVLSAVEGLQVAAPPLAKFILPISIAVLIILFSVQSHGTATVGKFFGPIMLTWFLVLGVLGVVNILKLPSVLAALSPTYAVAFFLEHPWISFLALGAVVLAITGAEAVYADMGHFGRAPIRLGWFFFVWPTLMLNYFGQGALLLTTPEAVSNPFYLMAPSWMAMPLVVLATLATVIASQAMISGVYSITSQAIQLGYCPRMTIRHTSDSEKGQIYIPGINWALLGAVIILVLGFQTSERLASAYGIAVTFEMVITTLLAFVVLGQRDSILKSKPKRWALFALLSGFLIIDLALFGANALKFLDGGWVPILIAISAFFLMTTWKLGRRVLFHHLHEGELPLDLFVDSIESNPPHRVEGLAVFMTGSQDTVPHALLHNLKHNKVLHEKVLFLTIQSTDIPYVAAADRMQVRQLSSSFWQVVATYGFKEEPSVPELMALLERDQTFEVDLMNTSFFLSRETIVPAKVQQLSWLRTRVFRIMQRNAARPTDFFKIPPNRVVEMGTQVAL